MKKTTIIVLFLVYTTLTLAQVTFNIYEKDEWKDNIKRFNLKCNMRATLSPKGIKIGDIYYKFTNDSRTFKRDKVMVDAWEANDNRNKSCGIEVCGGVETNGKYLIRVIYRNYIVAYKAYMPKN